MRALLTLLLLVSSAVAAVWFGALPPGLIPPAWDPNAPLDVRSESGPLLGVKLHRLRGDPALCRAALATAGLRASPAPDVPPRDGCGLRGAVRVAGGEVALEPGPFLASCPLAVGWALFESRVVQPAAERHFGRPVTGVSHLGSYACRDVRGGSGRSSHATADALDVSGFTLRGGRRVSLADWAEPEEGMTARASSETAFLREVRDGACRFFGAVLSPEYDGAHADHFHLQATGWGSCR